MRGIYYGWYVVGFATLIYMLMVGATFSAFGLFVVPVSADLGLSRADMNTALILMNLGNAVLAPFAGRMIDRLPVKRVMIAGAILMGLSLVVFGLSPWLWLSAIFLATALPAAYLTAGTLTITALIARWFTSQRGRAMALATIGMSLGGVAVTPLVGWLIETQGWRMALVVTGLVVTAILLAIALVLRAQPGPQDVERERPSAKPQSLAPPVAPAALAVPARMGAVLRAPHFWSITLGAALSMSVAQALGVTLVPLGMDGGLTIIQATSLISVMGGAAIAGALLLAVLADKVDRVLLLSGLFALMALMNAALLASGGYAVLLACSAFLGLTMGAATPTFYALLADRFGAASFGTVRGLTMPVVAGFGMIAIRFAGEVFDRTGGYGPMFSAFIAVQLVAAGLMFATRFAGPAASRQAAAATPTAP